VLTFTDVTVGLARLQHLLRELSAPFENEAEHAAHGRRILLGPAPGEQHTFGTLMVEEFFRRAGWDVAGGPRSPDEILHLVRREWLDVVGLSASCDILFDGLAGLVGAIRRASRNRNVGVLVGGRLFNEHPELVARVGADATAIDGRQAVRQVPQLLGLAAKRC
jgi:methanogenic corrinoid protein MtbC1